MKSVVGPHLGCGLDSTELGHTCMMCCTTYIPADIVPHWCFGFTLRSWICSILLVWPLSHSVWYCCMLGPLLCYEGWAISSTGSYGHHAVPCSLVVGLSIWNDLPLELCSLPAVLPLSTLYMSLKCFSSVMAGKGAFLSRFLKVCYTSPQNKWRKEAVMC